MPPFGSKCFSLRLSTSHKNLVLSIYEYVPPPISHQLLLSSHFLLSCFHREMDLLYGGVLMRPVLCMCARHCLTGFQCRYEIIAVGGGETSHKRLREEKRGRKKKEETMRSEKQQHRGQTTHNSICAVHRQRRHVHTKSSDRLIWGQEASILLPLHSMRL